MTRVKLCLIGFGFLVACGGAESTLFDPAATTPSTDPVASDDASPPPVTLPEFDAAQQEAAAPPTCSGYADPETTGNCHACTGSNCQANGCFGGWYCKLDTEKCVSKPDGC